MSAPIFECALPQPPSVNHYLLGNKNGSRRLSGAAKTFKARALQVLLQLPRAKLAGRLKIEMTFCFADNRRRDLDNYSKTVLDVMQLAGVFLDDSQFDEITLLRGDIAPKNGHVIIKIWELENDDVFYQQMKDIK